MSASKYKAGDNIVIKPRKLVEEEGNKRHFVNGMWDSLKGTDMVVPVKAVYGDTINVGGVLDGFGIHPCEVLGYAFEYGEEIEVSDGGENWRKAVFSGYRPGNPCAVSSIGSVYSYARPIQKNQISAKFVNQDGEDVTPLLSEESKINLVRGKITNA